MEIKFSPLGRPVTILLSQEDVRAAVIGWVFRAARLHRRSPDIAEKALRLAVRDGQWVGLLPAGIGIGLDIKEASFPGEADEAQDG